MKSTTFHQKIIFTAKIFVCTLLLGVLGWLSFAPTPPASAESATLSVTIQVSPPWVDVEDIARTGHGVPIVGESGNVGAARVYLDVNGNGYLDSDDILLPGTIDIGAGGAVTGTVQLPDTLTENATYQLIVEGDTINNNAGAYDDQVYDVIQVYLVGDGPILECVHNVDSPCLPDSPQAFGNSDDYTRIVINGENFGDLNNTTVTVGGQECRIISVEPYQIICDVPPALDDQIGPQDVVVCVNGLCGMIAGGFVYQEFAIPGVPGTGVFRIGDTVVTVKDIILWSGLMIIVIGAAILIMIVKTPKKSSYSVKSGASKKRGYRKQKVAFSPAKKTPKRRK